MRQLEEIAFAKVNLFLNVIGRDEQGYHLLESYFALLNCGDAIAIKESLALNCITENAEIREENIALKAFKAMEAYIGFLKPVEILINKKIPIAAGMGGGSSNAASTIRLVNTLYNLNLSMKEMADIAYNVGADVPFFIHNNSAFATGRGEKLLPLKLNISLPVLLVKPPVNVNTKEVYKLSVKSFTPNLEEISAKSMIEQIYYGKNDLTAPALIIAPPVSETLDIIAKQAGCIASRMSGSGSTCFGIFSDEEKAKQALYNLNKTYPKFWCHYQLLEL
ncbi:4-diphosphocytidyl-2C-methyl-D-erythritol kinase [endosymbiont of Acanthamoeba sp. UWC8]|uniref:4-(cytidine 5'-diphospho)-2-C-methyl-D-erythritol kinase n=1 Tax=endosymbiont of Acanthamoeba sp. UWC8 TaxID=86106 RepID=UPI0004D0D1F9|nr:4-(cytidine 5'-diphospho)-2-C-methyl-D-erythritol kinase [endosymbiont of Acanthamoeba sp. UWC8]AIF81391.1 4-diphosphocytidyl-2C-methyl-D-erythritol kinase [endosymbiont of Acanthamoeba sp. UWC8]